MATKVALYCRVSTSTKDQTTENQLRELNSYCDRMGYEVVKVYEDEVSGAKSRESRPAYNELCKDAFLKKVRPHHWMGCQSIWKVDEGVRLVPVRYGREEYRCRCGEERTGDIFKFWSDDDETHRGSRRVES